MNTLHRLKETMEEIRQHELSRYSKKLSEGEASQIEEITRNFVNNIVRRIEQQAYREASEEKLAQAVEAVFGLKV